ncbi:MAG: aryl-alcohol dehydrogenase-like oxidoreductase [Osedax symbiont Rs2]|nr:MAG: aryl-alcohol dehydrogenase-like oxidoreductase [Osedax symbiont Rs2]
MQYKNLSNTDLKVSRICLGTMTFGRQNTEQQAFEQLDFALAQGVNFIDTAELYPVPTAAATRCLTEQYIGNWIRARGNREKLIIGTKVCGPAAMVEYLRPNIAHDEHNIRTAVEGSLKRLNTDYIDLYQLHWPDRQSNFFGQLGYEHDTSNDGTPLLETLKVLKQLVDEGKVRYVGVSNESPWGVMSFLQLAKQFNLPKIASVQNAYSLLNRTTEIALAEVLYRENIDLLPYSPLGFGVLSGKYLNGALPENSRLQLFPHYSRYQTANGVVATAQYVQLAKSLDMDPAQLAIAFVASRPFVGSTIIGATDIAQLGNAIAAIDLELDADVLAKIEAIHNACHNPCP